MLLPYKNIIPHRFNDLCPVRDGTNALYLRLKKDDLLLVCSSIIKHCIRVLFGRKHLGYHNTSLGKVNTKKKMSRTWRFVPYVTLYLFISIIKGGFCFKTLLDIKNTSLRISQCKYMQTGTNNYCLRALKEKIWHLHSQFKKVL